MKRTFVVVMMAMALLVGSVANGQTWGWSPWWFRGNFGGNEVANSTFSTMTGWAGTNWSVNAGTVNHISGVSASLTCAACTAVIGQEYVVTYDVVGLTFGSITPRFGGCVGTAHVANATGVMFPCFATATTALAFAPDTGFSGGIDNVYVRKVVSKATFFRSFLTAESGSPLIFNQRLVSAAKDEVAFAFDYHVDKAAYDDVGLQISMANSVLENSKPFRVLVNNAEIASLNATGALSLLEQGASPEYHLTISASDLSADQMLTWPSDSAGVLTNNGSGTLSWAAAGGTSALLSATHTDTTAAAVQRGALITGQGAVPTWALLAPANRFAILQMGTDEPEWVGLDGAAGDDDGGSILLRSGEPSGDGSAGEFAVLGGDAGGAGDGGLMQVAGGDSVSGAGGAVYLDGGDSDSGAGGSINLEPGSGATNGSVNVVGTLGTEVVANGTFADLTGWAGANWAAAGTAVHTAGATTALTCAACTVVAGTVYTLTFDIVGGTAGTVTPSFGGFTGAAHPFGSAATIPYTQPARATTALAFTPSSTFDGAVDNVSLRPVSSTVALSAAALTSPANYPLILTKTLSHATKNEMAVELNYTTNKSAGDDRGLRISMYDAASPGTSYPFSIAVNGTDVLTVNSIGTLVGGTGVLGSVHFGTDGGRSVRSDQNNITLDLQSQRNMTTATGATSLRVFNGSTFSNSSGTSIGMLLAPTINQTATGAFTALAMQITETATGTGARKFLSLNGGASGTTERSYILADDGRLVTDTIAHTSITDSDLQPGMIVATSQTTDNRVEINPDYEASTAHASGVMPVGIYAPAHAGSGAAAPGDTIEVVTGGIAYLVVDEDGGGGTLDVTRAMVCRQSSGSAGYAECGTGIADGDVGYPTRAEADNVIVSLDDGNDVLTMTTDPTTLGWTVGDFCVYWDSGDTTVTGLADGGVYAIQAVTSTTVALAATKGGAKLPISSGTFASGAYLQRVVKVRLRFR